MSSSSSRMPIRNVDPHRGSCSQVQNLKQRFARLSLATPSSIQERLVAAAQKVDFSSLSELGKGNYAEVRKMVFEGKSYAVKVPTASSEARHIDRESELVNLLAKKSSSSSLPKCFWAGQVEGSGPSSAMMLMECVEGVDLFQAAVEEKSLPLQLCAGFEKINTEEQRHRLCSLQKLARDISAAIFELNCLGFMHRDIKPENIQVRNSSDREKVTFTLLDLGFARRLPSTSSSGRLTPCGSKLYVSPEVFTESYDQKIDIWSFGMTLYKIITGGTPIKRDEKGNLIVFDLNEIKYKPLPEVLPSETLASLINGCLKEDPKGRLSIDEVRAHPFLTEDLLSEDSAVASAYA